jgi:hypothetical protein
MFRISFVFLMVKFSILTLLLSVSKEFFDTEDHT